MLLLIDMGNTNLTIAGWNEEGKTFEFRLNTDRSMGRDGYALNLRAKLAELSLGAADFCGGVLCSVVPELDGVVSSAMRDVTGHVPVFLDKHGNVDGTEYPGEKENQLGNDLIAGAIGAKQRYSMPCIVADLGTTTTITPQDAGGHVLGTCIAPGVKLGLKAMAADASKLFSVMLQAPEHAIGTDTIECIQSGVVLGAASMLDGMADRMTEELGAEPSLVITGGLAPVIAGSCRRPYVYDPDILFAGMARYYELNVN